ncbi:MAG: ABC transporter substrate-binding protein [Clostridia bacterium]|nr:ABC transporter substrate-binding protein [Clostridia bacterium]
MKKFSICVMVLALVLASAGVSSAAPKQLVVGISSEPMTMDGTQVTDFNTDRVVGDMYNQVVRFGDGTMDIEPDLAERWEVSSDELVYTFYLRKDVKFHDGTPFNAEAVKFNYERLNNPDSKYYDTGIFTYSVYMFEMVKSVDVIDEFTVSFTLTEPFAPFISNIAMAQFSMVSPAAVEKYGRDITNNPVGTGPFRFVSWTRGSEVILERNPDYFKGPAKLDRLIFRTIIDDNVRQNALEAGTINLMTNILPDNLEALGADPKFQLLEQPGMHVWYLSMNCSKAPFDKKEVRQAMYYAIDRQGIVDNILLGTGVLAHNMVPPMTFAYTDDVSKYEYNPDKAKSLLAEAGYPDGFTVDFDIPESGSGMQQPEAMAIAMKSDLAKVGIIVNIIKTEWGAYLDQVFRPIEEQDMVLLEMSYAADNGDPDNFLYTLCAGRQIPPLGYNCAYYSNEEFDNILIKARTTSDLAKRTALYAEAQKMLMTEVPHLVVDHETQIVVMDRNITGFTLHPRALFRFHKVDFTD